MSFADDVIVLLNLIYTILLFIALLLSAIVYFLWSICCALVCKSPRSADSESKNGGAAAGVSSQEPGACEGRTSKEAEHEDKKDTKEKVPSHDSCKVIHGQAEGGESLRESLRDEGPKLKDEEENEQRLPEMEDRHLERQMSLKMEVEKNRHVEKLKEGELKDRQHERDKMWQYFSNPSNHITSPSAAACTASVGAIPAGASHLQSTPLSSGRQSLPVPGESIDESRVDSIDESRVEPPQIRVIKHVKNR